MSECQPGMVSTGFHQIDCCLEWFITVGETVTPLWSGVQTTVIVVAALKFFTDKEFQDSEVSKKDLFG